LPLKFLCVPLRIEEEELALTEQPKITLDVHIVCNESVGLIYCSSLEDET